MSNERSVVLVVDDMPENLRVLGEALEGEGYDVRVAASGEQALKIVGRGGLDLILLDIMMPGMDGYEVCQKLKADPQSAAIPVLFLTALETAEEEERGLHLGAVDFLTKPYNFALVKARVANHVALYRAQRELHRHNTELEALVAERSRDLAEAHQTLISVDAARFRAFQWIYRRLWDPQAGLFARGVEGLVGAASDNATFVEQAEVELREMIQSALLVVPRFRSPGELVWPTLPLRSLWNEAIVRSGIGEDRTVILWPDNEDALYVRAEPDLMTQALALLARDSGSGGQTVTWECESIQSDVVVFSLRSGQSGSPRRVSGSDRDWAVSLVAVFGGTVEALDDGWKISLPIVPRTSRISATPRRGRSHRSAKQGE